MKKHIKYLAMIFVVAIFVFGILCIKKFNYHQELYTKENEPQKTKMYYVPVTRYFSDVYNLSKENLLEISKNGNLLFESGETRNILSILGTEYSNIPETSEINKNLVGEKVAIVKWSSVNSGVKSLSYENNLLWSMDNVSSYGLSTEIESSEEEFNPKKISKLVFGGDVMLSRTVATKIRSFGSLAPWENIVNLFKNANISFLNLEVPFSDRYSPPTSGMSFIAPTKYVAGLTYSGVNIVSVANNHSANFGRAVFEDNLLTLENHNIKFCGGGLTYSKARKVSIIEENGIRFGFLCYNSIIGGLEASEKSSGVNTLKIEPWYRDNEIDIKKVENDIKKAKEEVDFLIVSPHWGVEYKHYPNTSQKNVAKRMIDAGADIIIGTHPHVVQGSEYYNGKYITYSLGNLIFDQEWSTATKQGTILELYTYGNVQKFVKLYPVKISSYFKPDFLSGNKKEDALSTILEESIGLN